MVNVDNLLQLASANNFNFNLTIYFIRNYFQFILSLSPQVFNLYSMRLRCVVTRTHFRSFSLAQVKYYTELGAHIHWKSNSFPIHWLSAYYWFGTTNQFQCANDFFFITNYQRGPESELLKTNFPFLSIYDRERGQKMWHTTHIPSINCPALPFPL